MLERLLQLDPLLCSQLLEPKSSSGYVIITCRLKSLLFLPLQLGLHQHQKFHQQLLPPLLLLQHLDHLQSLLFLFIHKICISNL